MAGVIRCVQWSRFLPFFCIPPPTPHPTLVHTGQFAFLSCRCPSSVCMCRRLQKKKHQKRRRVSVVRRYTRVYLMSISLSLPFSSLPASNHFCRPLTPPDPRSVSSTSSSSAVRHHASCRRTTRPRPADHSGLRLPGLYCGPFTCYNAAIYIYILLTGLCCYLCSQSSIKPKGNGKKTRGKGLV